MKDNDMINKPLIAAVAGFIAGGLLVSIAATTFDKPEGSNMATSDIGMSQMTAILQSLEGEAFDKEFLENMIVHHQGAINMAELARINAKHDEIKELANEVIAAQNTEINLMRTWQNDWNYMSMSNRMNH